eukprot:g42563.t1
MQAKHVRQDMMLSTRVQSGHSWNECESLRHTEQCFCCWSGDEEGSRDVESEGDISSLQSVTLFVELLFCVCENSPTQRTPYPLRKVCLDLCRTADGGQTFSSFSPCATTKTSSTQQKNEPVNPVTILESNGTDTHEKTKFGYWPDKEPFHFW